MHGSDGLGRIGAAIIAPRMKNDEVREALTEVAACHELLRARGGCQQTRSGKGGEGPQVR